ncbi:ADP-ribosylglycohydrolase family protein [Streptomyces sp. AC512_CC834]|uniref:ADP-ribosylglycohydrolase family protein n=1 Tax=Streptomyces sp. AC512_CC834 TaxID=2823691 RepID=UPI0027E480DE|nr:ADP-ribosylglycohydrolase family protein [Streptomyces sp. AC512_CC834]
MVRWVRPVLRAGAEAHAGSTDGRPQGHEPSARRGWPARMKRIQRAAGAAGAADGSAVGDALGPLRVSPPRERSPRGSRFRCRGRDVRRRWLGPGEATDDTQMAVLVAESVLERGGLDQS